jgi:hypothetical protein
MEQQALIKVMVAAATADKVRVVKWVCMRQIKHGAG